MARFLVSKIVREELKSMGLFYPQVSPETRVELQNCRAELLQE